MSLLNNDKRYQYCKQLSIWVRNVNTIRYMTVPFEDAYPCAVIRKNHRGLFALFVRGAASQRTRYKLEVKLACKVVVPDFTEVRNPESSSGAKKVSSCGA